MVQICLFSLVKIGECATSVWATLLMMNRLRPVNLPGTQIIHLVLHLLVLRGGIAQGLAAVRLPRPDVEDVHLDGGADERLKTAIGLGRHHDACPYAIGLAAES